MQAGIRSKNKLMLNEVKQATGNLFGSLFTAFDHENFLRSIDLFKRRLDAFNFDVTYFKGKKCLDVGCGGGRMSIAMAMFGAAEVTGVDVGESGVADARKRAEAMGLDNVQFQVTSGDNLPFKDGEFDFVIFSGVIMHMEQPEKAVEEISRVMKSGGMVYMLVYATGGLRWPLVNVLRPLAQQIGFEKMDKALRASGLDVNKRRTYLDDLHVPLIDFYTWERLTALLSKNNLTDITRHETGRFDHEESIEDYRKDLNGFHQLFEGGKSIKADLSQLEYDLFDSGSKIIQGVLDTIERTQEAIDRNEISYASGMKILIGQGHHRLFARKK
jgi:ubiquinone/menaquinone biosynthesis C-methylase UbiE